MKVYKKNNPFDVWVNKKAFILLSLIILLTLPVFISAVSKPLDIGNTISVGTVIDTVLGTIIWPLFIGAIVIMIIYAGFLFVTAAGDPSKVSTAKKAVLWTIIGVIAGILAFSVYGIISNVILPPQGGPPPGSCSNDLDCTPPQTCRNGRCQ